jgi:hypothetical protein
VADPRVAVVIMTHNRADELLDTLARLTCLPEQPPVLVVDNGSDDGTAEPVRARFPSVQVLALERNVGAVARSSSPPASAARQPPRSKDLLPARRGERRVVLVAVALPRDRPARRVMRSSSAGHA